MSIRASHPVPVLALLLLASNVASAAPAPGGRSPGHGGSTVSLTLDGAAAGSVAELDVPFPASEVVIESQGADYFLKKHLGGLIFRDLTFTVGTDASPALRDWIGASWMMNYQRKNGSFAIGGGEVQFYNALLSEVGMPALDAASTRKGAGISIRIAPEYTRRVKGKAKHAAPTPSSPISTSSFSIELDGLDTSRVVRVDALTVKQTVVSDDIGNTRDYVKEPGKIEFPNLSLYLAASDATSFIAWHEDFVINGNCTDDKEKQGRVMYRSEQGKAVFEVKLANVGIYAIDEVVHENRRLLKVDLYVERMELAAADKPGAGKEGAAAPVRRTVSKRRPVPGKRSSGKVPKK